MSAAELRQSATDAAVEVGKLVAAQVGDLEAVGAAVARLVLVGVGYAAALGHGDGLRVVVRVEGQHAAGSGEVRPRDGAERDGAVHHFLRGGGVAGSGDGERAAACILHGKRSHLRLGALPHCQCRDGQHQGEDSVHDSGCCSHCNIVFMAAKIGL